MLTAIWNYFCACFWSDVPFWVWYKGISIVVLFISIVTSLAFSANETQLDSKWGSRIRLSLLVLWPFLPWCAVILLVLALGTLVVHDVVEAELPVPKLPKFFVEKTPGQLAVISNTGTVKSDDITA